MQIFGDASSPSVCSFVLRQAVKDFGSAEVVREVVENFCVDNLMTFYPSVTEAIAVAQELPKALIKEGFKLM